MQSSSPMGRPREKVQAKSKCALSPSVAIPAWSPSCTRIGSALATKRKPCAAALPMAVIGLIENFGKFPVRFEFNPGSMSMITV